MPARNSRKPYLENAYYHIYNRGVEKRRIFKDKQDYNVFLSYLRDYLTPKDEEGLSKQLADPSLSSAEKDKILKMLRLNNFHSDITLLAYCLMPNHFHFFIKQKSAGAIDKFMNSLGTRYTMYFNRKYQRVGSLYQGVYKAVHVTNEPQFLYLSKYIHKQALGHPLQGEALQAPKEAQPSSYDVYTKRQSSDIVRPEEILSFFTQSGPSLSYASFVLEKPARGEHDIVRDIMIEG